MSISILADPSFDPIVFIKNVNLYLHNPSIMREICRDPIILISLIQDGEYHFLVNNPELIDANIIFPKIHDLGYPVYQKTSMSKRFKQVCQYGVIIKDAKEGLAFTYRRVGTSGHSLTLKVLEKCNTFKLKESWDKAGQVQMGKPLSRIAQIRNNVEDWISQNLKLKKLTLPLYSTQCNSYWASDKTHYTLAYAILKSGKNHIRVKVPAGDYSNKYEKPAFKIHMYDPGLEFKIINWALNTEPNTLLEASDSYVHQQMEQFRISHNCR